MNTPYNTGRVLIGCMYQETSSRIFSRDELTIQDALLNKRKGGFFERIAAVIYRWL